MTSGQVFRWTEIAPGTWQGFDGPHQYEIKVNGETYEIKTNADEGDFRSLFRLETDLQQLQNEILSEAPELAPYIGSLPGFRLMRPSSPTEALFSFLCTSNNHILRITPMVRALAAYGEQNIFPTVEQISTITEEELRAKGFGYRAKSIPEAAKQILEQGGEEWLIYLKQKPYDEAIEELLKLNGVGPKLADCISLFALDKMESVPVDTHVWQAACRVYFPEFEGKSVTSARYKAIGDHLRTKFGDRAAWVQQFLFYGNLTMKKKG